MRRSKRGLFAAAILAFALVMAIPVAAYAALEDPVTFTSATNPSVGADFTWRWFWGNTPFPNITTSAPSDAGPLAGTLGFIYDVRQVDLDGIGAVVPGWDTSSLSPKPTGTLINDTFDIARVNTVYGWTQYDGATKSGEGMYVATFLFYNQFRLQDPSLNNQVVFGIDFTNPSVVSHLAASTAGLTVTAAKWTEARRRDISWDRRAYDSLSGVGGYQVAVNGANKAFVHNTAPDPSSDFEPYAQALIDNTQDAIAPQIPPINHVTVEDLPAGLSTISITVVDRATNKSTPVSVSAAVDYDTPTLAIVAPTSGRLVNPTPTFSVKAADAAGIAKVSYYVDNILVGAVASAPFALKANLSAFSSGAHTLKVVAEDRIGSAPGTWNLPHTVTKTVGFSLDKVRLVVSSFTRTPTIFYPIRVDKYKDTSTTAFTLSKAAVVTLTVRNSKGSVVRSISASRKAGRSTIVWNGRWTDVKARTGTFSYQVTARDVAGNVTSTGKLYTYIRNYELIKTSSNSVRVVAR